MENFADHDDPLPAPSTSRQLHPYRARSSGSSRGSSLTRSRNSSRASSIARTMLTADVGPSNFGSMASISTADGLDSLLVPDDSFTMEDEISGAGPSNARLSPGSDIQIDGIPGVRGRKRPEPAAAEASTSGRTMKRIRLNSAGAAAEVADGPEIIDLVDDDEPDIIDLSSPITSHAPRSPLLSSSLAQSAEFPPPSPTVTNPSFSRIPADPIDVDSFFLDSPAAPTASFPKLPPSVQILPGHSDFPISSGSNPRSTVEPLSSYSCPICFCPPTYATLTPCGHVCCGECLFTAVKTTMARTAGMMIRDANVARCPVCRATLPGWDGKGGGVIGLKPRAVLSL